MLSNPYPADDRFAKANANDHRFENTNFNLTTLAGKQRLKMLTDMYNTTSRNDIYTSSKDALPDNGIYFTSDYNRALNLFDKS